ncbi:MAG: hypothetical protein ACR2LM_13100 [Pyrinomonadaceae bacterium]
MKKLTLLCLMFLSVSSIVSLQGAQAQEKEPGTVPDKVKNTRTIQAYFIGFEMGDYAHAVVRRANRKRSSFFLGGPVELEYFLAAHKDKPLLLTYQVVDSSIPEAGGVMTIERLVSAKFGNESNADWWKRVGRSSDVDSLRKKYDALVERATIK